MGQPKYTIIIPSYNGGDYLKQCVQSVLAQSYGDFELAVLENGNVDNSVGWLFSLGDARIKVYPCATVLPIEENWARALEIPKNEFITFFGHDDLMDANYLEVMTRLIDREPEASLYFAHFRYINEEGRAIRSCQPVPLHETGAEFLKAFLQGQNELNGTGFMMRSEDYDAVGGIPQFKRLLYADFVLWFTLTHDSHKVTAHQECFSYRLHATSTTTSSKPQDHLQAIVQFIDSFSHFKSNNHDFNEVFEDYGAAFMIHIFSIRYIELLVQSNEMNRRLDSRLLNNYMKGFSQVSFQAAQNLRNSKRVRLHRCINRHQLLRWACSIYLKSLHIARHTTSKAA